MSLKQEHFRNEWKYMLSLPEKAFMERRLGTYMRPDSHARPGGYTVRSLYFDDLWNTAYEEKTAGVLMRRKYRIRIYDYQDRHIRLERKKKFGSYIYKESAPLTREEYFRIVEGDYGFLLRSEHPLLQEFYIECVSRGMRPRVIVDYEREPWVLDEGTVRITFDRQVRAAVGGFDLFDPTLPALAVMRPENILLEVKFTEYLPQIIRGLLPGAAAEFTAYSKYVMCYEKTRYLHTFDHWFENGHETEPGRREEYATKEADRAGGKA